jgi:hypothetical protein
MAHKVGKVFKIDNMGTMWRLWLETKGKKVDTVDFDWRPFKNFYEGVSGGNFYEDLPKGKVHSFFKDKKVKYSGDRTSINLV